MNVAKRVPSSACWVLLAAFALIAPASARGEPGKISKEKLSSGADDGRSYFLYIPTGVEAGRKLPLILCLHGSGRDGEPILSQWKSLAEKEKILLAGPNSADSIHWNFPDDGPLFLRDVVEDVGARYPVDDRRVYLFGHSAGAEFALIMGTVESEYFAAAVIHAGSLRPTSFSTFDRASRKIPYMLIIGTRDRFFSVESVQATRDALKSRGIPVEYLEMAGHTHDYYGSAGDINPKAWEFLKKNQLPADPKYTAYRQ
jgi:poly(3-hydroxybutyrate) depolymerase